LFERWKSWEAGGGAGIPACRLAVADRNVCPPPEIQRSIEPQRHRGESRTIINSKKLFSVVLCLCGLFWNALRGAGRWRKGWLAAHLVSPASGRTLKVWGPPGSGPMKVVVAAAVGLLAMLGTHPSWGGGVEPVRLPDGSALPAVEFDRHVASLFGRLGCNAG